LSLQENFPLEYENIEPVIVHKIENNCDCEFCSCDKKLLENVEKKSIHIVQAIGKNKIYNCEKRIGLILNFILNFDLENLINLSADSHIIIMVPIDSSTLVKISNIIIDYSNSHLNSQIIRGSKNHIKLYY
jgi:hypothetical protein